MAIADVVVPVGTAVAVGAAVAAALRPRWRAAGLPYVVGYGKNVELAAVWAALAAGTASRLVLDWRLGRWLAGLLAGAGLVTVLTFADVPLLLSGWRPLFAVSILVTSLGVLWPDAPPSRGPSSDRTAGWAVLLLAGALTLSAFVLAIEPLTIDVFHHGEVLASAVDLLHGGEPFKTFIWPHGVHDTGLTALWVLITGKVGTSPVALARATCSALGVVATYCLASRLLRSRVGALVASAVMTVAPALVHDESPVAGPSFVLYHLGVLSFVVFAFAMLTASRPREILAGACLGLGYVFRIETALYGLGAALAVVVQRALVEPGGSSVARVTGPVVRLLVGAAMAVAGCHALFGWPGSAWFAYTLGDLPRYHRDAVGLPFPWPLRASHAQQTLGAAALAWLALVLLLLVRAARAVLSPRSDPAASRARASEIVFIAVFAVLALESSLERADAPHVLQWSALPVIATALFAVALLGERLAWTRGRSALAIVLVLGLVDVGALEGAIPRMRTPAGVVRGVTSAWRLAREEVAPNPASGPCADTMFTATEARLEPNRRFIEDACGVESLLRAHDVTDLAIVHSAPWYHVRFGMAPPTRFFAPARAYTPARQLELIADLRLRQPQALLTARGYGALTDFDVPDFARVPVLDAYLRERRRDVVATPTPLGELFLWDEAARCPPSSPSDEAASPVKLAADLALYWPLGRAIFARGSSAAGSEVVALESELPDVDVRFEPGLGVAGSAAPDTGVPPGWRGWDLVARPTPEPWRDAHTRRALAVRAVLADGRHVRAEVDLSAALVLGELSGVEWDGLESAVETAARLGRADRVAACEAAGNAPTCACQGPAETRMGTRHL